MRSIVLSSSLIAFSIACGYAKLLLFPYLFFVELFTVAVFLSGLLAGPAWGLWIGAVARLVFSIANPYGPPHPWILVAQVVGAALELAACAAHLALELLAALGLTAHDVSAGRGDAILAS